MRVVREGGETLSNTRGNSEVNLEQTVFGYTYIDNVSTLRSCAVYELTFPQYLIYLIWLELKDPHGTEIEHTDNAG